MSDFSGEKEIPIEHMDMKFKRPSVKLACWLDFFAFHIVLTSFFLTKLSVFQFLYFRPK